MNMKSIKYIIGLIAVVAFLALPAAAQEFRSQSFLNVQAVYLTNLCNPTNLATASSAGTNVVGLTYTNNGVRFVADGTNQTRVNPFRDVSLWALRDGSGAWSTGATNATGILYNMSYATVSVTMTSGSGADSAIPFVVTPVYDGVNEATVAAEEWTFAFTPTASSTQTFSTNAPLYRWPGASKLRIRRAVNSDTTAAGHVIVKALNLNGFPP